MIDKYLSDKLRLISFFSMIMVVFIHAYNLGEEIIDNVSVKKDYCFFFQFFVSQGIARIAVPIFFIISGYLLFVNKKWNLSVYKSSLRKRFKTLVVPYLLWSILVFVVYLLLQNIPQTASFFKQKHITSYSISEIIEAIFINPFPFQFWFVRDLFLFVILSPLIYIAISSLRWGALLILLAAWCFQIDFLFFSNEALFFFVFGSFLGINNFDLNKNKLSAYCFSLLFSWVLIVFLETTLLFLGIGNGSNTLVLLHKIGILAGVFAVWFVYDFLFIKFNSGGAKILALGYLSFFVYAFHEPLLDIFKIIFYRILGKSQLAMLIIYIVAPVLVILISTMVGKYLKKFMPNFYAIMTGGRQ